MTQPEQRHSTAMFFIFEEAEALPGNLFWETARSLEGEIPSYAIFAPTESQEQR